MPPKTSVEWKFDLILCREDVELPEYLHLNSFVDLKAYQEEWKSWEIKNQRTKVSLTCEFWSVRLNFSYNYATNQMNNTLFENQ